MWRQRTVPGSFADKAHLLNHSEQRKLIGEREILLTVLPFFVKIKMILKCAYYPYGLLDLLVGAELESPI